MHKSLSKKTAGKKKLNVVIEKTKTGFSAYLKEFPICTTGSNIPQLMGNTYEAIQLYFEDSNTSVSNFSIKYEIDFKQFFQYYKVLNAKVLADKMGMNPSLLSQYVQGKKRPSELQTQRILKAIHEIGVELSSLNLIYA